MDREGLPNLRRRVFVVSVLFPISRSFLLVYFPVFPGCPHAPLHEGAGKAWDAVLKIRGPRPSGTQFHVEGNEYTPRYEVALVT